MRNTGNGVSRAGQVSVRLQHHHPLPPRLEVGLEAGASAIIGDRWGGQHGEVVTTGYQLGIDGRFRIVGPLSLGLWGEYLPFTSQPSSEALVLAAQFRNG